MHICFFKFCFYSSGHKCGRSFRFWHTALGVGSEECMCGNSSRCSVILLIVLPLSCSGNLGISRNWSPPVQSVPSPAWMSAGWAEWGDGVHQEFLVQQIKACRCPTGPKCYITQKSCLLHPFLQYLYFLYHSFTCYCGCCTSSVFIRLD